MFPHKYVKIQGLQPQSEHNHRENESVNGHARLSHQMPDTTADKSANMVIRAAPLIYGAVLGSFGGNLSFGLFVGFLVAVFMQLGMKT